jgi:hypothetical protein
LRFKSERPPDWPSARISKDRSRFVLEREMSDWGAAITMGMLNHSRRAWLKRTLTAKTRSRPQSQFLPPDIYIRFSVVAFA